MGCYSCGRQSLWKELSKAAAKLAASQFRRIRGLGEYRDWPARATTCEKCPLRVLRGTLAYCGQPLLSQVSRSAFDGCGCPVIAKAKDPTEHCPLDSRHRPAVVGDGDCNCKWCSSAVNGPRARNQN